MTRWAVVDTGPLVALLDRRERHHAWAVDALFGLIEKGALRIAFHLEEHLREIKALRAKYRDRPISLADACLVRMAELFDDHHVFTLDSDFTIYRKHGRKSLALIHPSGE